MHALDALGNAQRRDILLTLREGPRSVGELAEVFPISRPAVSRHLRVLREAGLVAARPDGQRTLYEVDVRGFESVRDYLDAFWDEALSRLQALAEVEQATLDRGRR
ncbi:MAG: winged helix-turn-helix transcriptional regulator [Alphaproteobacteria bacterium]|nr:winged helix-turn-helix transcriptional regulator [Alphaproteobacteria bacterium]